MKSDHCAVLFTISCASPGVVKKSITYRKWKSIDVLSVWADISDAFEDFAYQNFDTAVRTYNSTLADIIDNHAPQKSRIVTVRADKPWYTAELSQEKRLRRKCERKYKQSKLTVDKIYCGQKAIPPSHDCAQSLANTFVNYFNEKIELIRNNLETSLNSSTDQVPDSVSIFCGVSFEQFNVVSEADIRKIICSSPTKSCALDPIPTWLLKQCQDQLAPVLTIIVNASLSCAEFPTELKKAFLAPLIKKIIFHCENFKNYRPVSNLSFISKLVERVVCVQLVEHLKTNNLYEIFQSAYRQLHSTETALIRVQNDLLQAVDNEGRAILVLLDLSAAFDTIDHQKLLNLLNQSFGIKGVALKWFESYLKDRTQTVQIGSCTSTPVTLKYGVPRGSVLGPILLTMYTTPFGNIFRKHGLNFHLYADDTQLYISFQPGVSVSKETAISCLEACIKDIKIWMTNNLLKLNDDKTELIVITTHSNTSHNQHLGINIGDSLITPSSEPPRNLGVLFDLTCSLNDHVSKICKSINYNLYSTGKIRKYLDTQTASITSRLDYFNSLL